MRSQNAMRNMATSLLLQLLTAVNGILIPRLILGTYGSAVNGLVISITQFLSYASLLEGGVGGVVRAELFGPLERKDTAAISAIFRASKRFYGRIAGGFGAYVLGLAALYPLLVRGEFAWGYVASLVVVIAVGTLFEYFFCLPYINLISADQKSWIVQTVNGVVLLVNMALTWTLLRLGASVHLFKLLCGFLLAVKPVIYATYVRRHYGLRAAGGAVPALKQKMDGLVHSIAQFIFSNVDVALATIFLTASDVSVYGIYYLVISGIMRVIMALADASSAGLGNVMVTEGVDRTREIFGTYEWLQALLTVIMYATTAVMLMPFIRLYTANVTDANYIQPVFGGLLLAAEAMYCVRTTYTTLILSAGKFEDTRWNAIAEAGVNLLLSLALIKPLGLAGLAIGTLAGMMTRTVMDINYLRREVIRRSPLRFLRLLALSLAAFAAAFFLGRAIPIPVDTWPGWVLKAAASALCSGAVALALFVPTHRREAGEIRAMALRLLRRGR